MIEGEETNIKHLKKCLRVLHISLEAAKRAEYGHMVIEPLYEAIRQVHQSLAALEGKL